MNLSVSIGSGSGSETRTATVRLGQDLGACEMWNMDARACECVYPCASACVFGRVFGQWFSGTVVYCGSVVWVGWEVQLLWRGVSPAAAVVAVCSPRGGLCLRDSRGFIGTLYGADMLLCYGYCAAIGGGDCSAPF